MPEIRRAAVYNSRSIDAFSPAHTEIRPILTLLIGIAYVGFMIYLANQQDAVGERGALLRWLLYAMPLLATLYAIFIFQVAYFAPPDTPSGVDRAAAEINLVLTLIFSAASAQITASEPLRWRLRRILPHSATYKPDSAVHTTALVLMLSVLWLTVSQFLLGGGLTGLAENFETNGIGFADVLVEQIIWVIVSLLGVGLFLRRSAPLTWKRLGLRLPTLPDIGGGIGMGLALFASVILVSTLWAMTVTPEELQQQTAASAQLARAFDSLPLALMVSLVVAFGEEIFFRGALQPVFGIPLTSLYFAALHTQYTLTPATIVIFITALGLGWLRERYSTSAAIIGHFVYNFIQLALSVLVGSAL